MQKLKILKIYSYIYYILILLTFLFIVKFISDFYSNNTNKRKEKNDVTEYKNIILKPKLQFDNGGFQFIEAESGQESNQEYTFNNVKTYGDFGKASAGKLEVKDNQNILEFTENPKFTIYTNKVKK